MDNTLDSFAPGILPNGVRYRKFGLDYILTDTDGQTVLLAPSDIDRLYGIIHPTKVHGKWKGYCGEGQEELSDFEKAIKDTSENKQSNNH